MRVRLNGQAALCVALLRKVRHDEPLVLGEGLVEHFPFFFIQEIIIRFNKTILTFEIFFLLLVLL